MKINDQIKYTLIAVLLALPVNVWAADAPAPKPTPQAMCPAANEMDSLVRDVHNLSKEMGAIADDTKDAALKVRTQKMEEHLAVIAFRARKIHDEMHGERGGFIATYKGQKK